MPRIIDILIAKQTDKRGTCDKCKRENIALGADDTCLACFMETPGLAEAVDKVAERQLDHLLGRGKPGEN